MRKNFSTPLYDEECQRFIHFCHILIYRINLPRNLFRRESIMQLLRVFYWDIYVSYKRNPKAAELVKYTRKEKLLFDFLLFGDRISYRKPGCCVLCAKDVRVR